MNFLCAASALRDSLVELVSRLLLIAAHSGPPAGSSPARVALDGRPRDRSQLPAADEVDLGRPTTVVAEGRASGDVEESARLLLEAAWKLPTWAPLPLPASSPATLKAAASRLALRCVDAEYYDAQKVRTNNDAGPVIF